MRVIVHQGLKTEEMKNREPRKTKALPFIDNSTNMYITKVGGGMTVHYCSSRFPGNTWDGFIISKDSDKLVEDMIDGLKWVQRNFLETKPKIEKVKVKT
jgi:hypothetical protein